MGRQIIINKGNIRGHDLRTGVILIETQGKKVSMCVTEKSEIRGQQRA